MPYVNVNVSKALTPAETDTLKREIAGIIGLIPGKTEQVLMIDIEDGKTLYYRGELQDNGAYVDARLYGRAETEDKAAFTRAMFDVLGRVLDVQKNQAFVTIQEFCNWGVNGDQK